MPVKIEFTDQERQEYSDFLDQKRQKLLKELDKIDQILTKLISENGHSSNSVINDVPVQTSDNPTKIIVSGRETTGWKYKIDDVLKASYIPLPASEIVKLIIKAEPELSKKLSAARKSVSSVLSTNSKLNSDRYIKKDERGIWVYSLNQNYNAGK